MIEMPETDVIIVQKQTVLERYSNFNVNFDDLSTPKKDGIKGVHLSHETHTQTRTKLLQILEQKKLSYNLMNLDELKQKNIPFFQVTNTHKGLTSKKQLIISLGGDGTLLNASHFVGGKTKLLGINSCPTYSVGYLCAANPSNMEGIISQILNEVSEKIIPVRRLKVCVDSSDQNLPLALNDVLICNKHPAASSRYEISVQNLEINGSDHEIHISSGIWISNAAGSTAAISAYGFPPLPIHDSKVYVACREPYLPKKDKMKMGHFVWDGDSESVIVHSRMRQGIACIDGPDAIAPFGFGTNISISSPKECALNLVLSS